MRSLLVGAADRGPGPGRRPSPAGADGALEQGAERPLQLGLRGTRTIRARSTTLIWPFSSDTTTATASVSSVMPSAARCRVPNRSERVISVSGSSAAAARMRSPRMMTAPSWSSVAGPKIVHSSSCDRSAWSMTPVSAISSRPVSRSSTMSAPWPSRDRIPAALATSAGDVLDAALLRRGQQPAERPDPPDPLERAPQLGLEHDDEREQPDDGARLEQLGEQPQLEELGEGVDAEQDRHADDEGDRARARGSG